MVDTPSVHTYRYPRPALTADVVLASLREESLHLLLIQRRHDPFQGQWALPGGFVNEMEPLATGASRELQEETGVHGVTLRQCGAFGTPGRDPRGWTVSIAFTGLLPPHGAAVHASDDAAAAQWFPVSQLPPLAFDHAYIIAVGLQFLRQEALFFLHASGWLGDRFPWKELLRLYRILQGNDRDDALRLKKNWMDAGVLVRVHKKAKKKGKSSSPALWRLKLVTPLIAT